MLDLFLGLFGGIWPYVIGAIGVVAGIAGTYIKGRSDMRRKMEVGQVKRRLETLEERKELEHEAESQDDTALADRLTRK